MLRSEFVWLQNRPIDKGSAKEQLPVKIKELAKEYKITGSNKQRIEVSC